MMITSRLKMVQALSRLSHPMKQQQLQQPCITFLQFRNFAQPAKWKQKQSKRKKPATENRNVRQQTPRTTGKRGKQHTPVHDTISQPADSALELLEEVQQEVIPPALLLPTGNEYAYVAQIAAQRANLNPRSLFATKRDEPIPESFRRGAFHYLSPAVFGHKLATTQPEVAFLGRSNSGKSSLVNALMKRTLARTSKQPGRTQQVQYYGFLPANRDTNEVVLEHVSAFLVDLPGYGYAAAPDSIADAWQTTTQEWLLDRYNQNGSGTLKRLFLLQDGRHGAQAVDLQVQQWLQQHGIPYTIVLTKVDAVSRAISIKYVNQACTTYHERLLWNEKSSNSNQEKISMSPVVHITSSRSGQGMAALWDAIETEFASSWQNDEAYWQSDFDSDNDDVDAEEDAEKLSLEEQLSRR